MARTRRRRPRIDWSLPQQDWEFPIRIPRNRRKPRGPYLEGRARLLSAVTYPAVKINRFVARPIDLGPEQSWCNDWDLLLCFFTDDGRTLVAIRKATERELKQLRVPRFIQSDEWPLCCGRSMSYIGEIDELGIADEPPLGAKLWWHDAVVFHVFSCAICLECKAVGDQF